MKFIIVRKRWYHGLLNRFKTTKLQPKYQVHLSVDVGNKNGRWYLCNHKYYEHDLVDTVHPLNNDKAAHEVDGGYEIISTEYDVNDGYKITSVEHKVDTKYEVVTEPQEKLLCDLPKEEQVIREVTDIFYDLLTTIIAVTHENFIQNKPISITLDQAKVLHDLSQKLLWDYLKNYITSCHNVKESQNA